MAKHIGRSLGTFEDIDIVLVVVVVVVEGGGRMVDPVVCVQTLYSYWDIISSNRNGTQFLLICCSKTNLETELYRKPEIIVNEENLQS